MEYSILSKGKRLRPILTLMSGLSVGGKKEDLLDLAMALELIHTASLIHDDVVDSDRVRRGKPTLYRNWKNKSILTGDVCYALACNLITQYGDSIWQIVSTGAMELCDGQFLDVSLSLQECTEDEYLRKIRKKSASLFNVSAKAGAIVGGGSPDEITSLSNFGNLFGMAYQLKDDLEELLDGQAPSDLLNGRVTLPYLHLYQNGNSRIRESLVKNFGSRRIPKEELASILGQIRESDSIEYCKKKIAKYVEESCDSLSELRESKERNHLLEFVNQIIAV